jgi:predicted permease
MSQADLVYRIIAIIFPVFSIVAIGYFYARHRHDTDMSSGNRINMDIFTPALIFDYMSGSEYALTDYLFLSIGCVFVVLGSGVIAWPVARAFGYRWKTLVPPMMFNNCGNMGLPLVVLAFGESMLPAAILLLAISNFLHFLVGQQLITQHWSPLPETLRQPIHMLGLISIPLMLFSLGVRMLAIDLTNWKISLVGSLLCPLSGLAIALPFVYLVPLPEAQIPLLVLFSVLPPAVLNFMVAERYEQEPHRATGAGAGTDVIGELADGDLCRDHRQLSRHQQGTGDATSRTAVRRRDADHDPGIDTDGSNRTQAGFSAGHADRPRRGGLRRHRNLPGVISAVLYRHHRHGYVHRIW